MISHNLEWNKTKYINSLQVDSDVTKCYTPTLHIYRNSNTTNSKYEKQSDESKHS